MKKLFLPVLLFFCFCSIVPLGNIILVWQGVKFSGDLLRRVKIAGNKFYELYKVKDE